MKELDIVLMVLAGLGLIVSAMKAGITINKEVRTWATVCFLWQFCFLMKLILIHL